jgi:hypothetical protein
MLKISGEMRTDAIILRVKIGDFCPLLNQKYPAKIIRLANTGSILDFLPHHEQARSLVDLKVPLVKHVTVYRSFTGGILAGEVGEVEPF